MLAYDLVVLSFAACCGWLTGPLEFMAQQRPEMVSDTTLQTMKGRRVTVDAGPAFSEAGMQDPAGEIGDSLAAALAGRFGLQFDPGRRPDGEALVLGMHTLEWIVEPAWKDYRLRYRGEATLVDPQSGRRLGRAWCDRNAPTGKASYDDALKDRRALTDALNAAADACLRQLRVGLIAEAR